MLVLAAPIRPRLDRYFATIARFGRTYPDCWRIIAIADVKMSSEHFDRVLRTSEKLRAERSTAGVPSKFSTAKPWDTVFHDAANDE
eukprot:14747444-Heterocapsa_arctica.AAC.1